MEQIEIQYVNEYRKKKNISGAAFVILACLGFLCTVGILCGFLWVFK